MFNLSLGAGCSVPPMTLPGKIVNPAAAVAAVPTNSRREMPFVSCSSLITPPLNLTVEKKSTLPPA
jgi:hypothetical protein